MFFHIIALDEGHLAIRELIRELFGVYPKMSFQCTRLRERLVAIWTLISPYDYKGGKHFGLDGSPKISDCPTLMKVPGLKLKFNFNMKLILK